MGAPFKVLETFPSIPQGTTIDHLQKVECLDCGFQFIQTISSGCFHYKEHPLACPRCGNPFNKILKNKKQRGEKYNPSKR